MAPLPRYSDSIMRLFLVLIAGAILGIPALLMAWVRTPLETDVGEAPEQPMAFDHRHHARDDGIDCLYCHHDAERTANAGVPDTALCMGCHGQIWNDSPQTALLRESWQARRPIRWRRVADLPDFVFFDHSVHVAAGVGCESCHGRVDRMAAVYLAHPMDMGFCLECHRDPAPHLRPPEAITRMGYRTSRTSGERIRAQLHVAPGTYCTACHR